MAASKQLQIPEVALRDEKSYEIARVWVAEGAEHVSLLVGVWKDPAAWGILLADLARHVVNAFEQEDQLDREDLGANQTNIPRRTQLSHGSSDRTRHQDVANALEALRAIALQKPQPPAIEGTSNTRSPSLRAQDSPPRKRMSSSLR